MSPAAQAPHSAYATAYEAHYTDKDLGSALYMYQQLIADHPNSEEAQYARSQIANIAKGVVPAQEHLMAVTTLARSWIGRSAGNSQGSDGPWNSYPGRDDSSDEDS